MITKYKDITTQINSRTTLITLVDESTIKNDMERGKARMDGLLHLLKYHFNFDQCISKDFTF